MTVWSIAVSVMAGTSLLNVETIPPLPVRPRVVTRCHSWAVSYEELVALTGIESAC